MNACYICQEITGHSTSQCPKVQCKNCGIFGHVNKNCPNAILNVRKPGSKNDKADDLYNQALSWLKPPKKHPEESKNQWNSREEESNSEWNSNPTPGTSSSLWSSSRDSLESPNNLREFEPLRKKPRNLDHETLDQSNKNHDFIDLSSQIPLNLKPRGKKNDFIKTLLNKKKTVIIPDLLPDAQIRYD